MRELLQKQLNHLDSIDKYLGLLAKNSAQDKLIQIGQLVEERAINIDEDEVVSHLERIDSIITRVDKFLQDLPEVNEKLRTNLDNLTKEISKNTKSVSELQEKYTDLAKQESKTPVNKSIFESFSGTIQSIKDTFGALKSSVTNKEGKFSAPKAFQSSKDAIMSSISGKYADKMRYIQDQRNLGSDDSRSTLEDRFEKRHAALILNERNEAKLAKNLGGLTEDEYFAGGRDEAKQIQKTREEVGNTLYSTDIRSFLNKDEADKQEDDKRETTDARKTSFADSVESITNAVPSGESISPILATAEDKMETKRETLGFHDKQLDLLQTLVDNSGDELKLLSEISETLKKKPNTTSGMESPLDSMLPDVDINPDSTPKGGKGGGKGGKGGGSRPPRTPPGKGGLRGMLSKGGELIRSGTKTLTSLGTSAAQRVGPIAARGLATVAPLAFNPIVATSAILTYAGYKAADTFSESFGEGGFELIQKLRKSNAISYGLDTTPEVDDWKQIEALSRTDLKTLIATGEFEGKDLERIQQILSKKHYFKEDDNTPFWQIRANELMESDNMSSTDPQELKDAAHWAELKAKDELIKKGIDPYGTKKNPDSRKLANALKKQIDDSLKRRNAGNNSDSSNLKDTLTSAGPTSAGPTSAGPTPINQIPDSGNLAKNQAEAYKAAISEGLSDTAARALVANMTGEGLRTPGTVNKDHNSRGEFAGMRRGIVQWDESRSKAIQKEFGKLPNEMTVAEQTQAAIWEMKTNPEYKKSWQALQGNDSDAMVSALVKNYERPANPTRDIDTRLGHFNALPTSFDSSGDSVPSKSANALNNDINNSDKTIVNGVELSPGSPELRLADMEINRLETRGELVEPNTGLHYIPPSYVEQVKPEVPTRNTGNNIYTALGENQGALIQQPQQAPSTINAPVTNINQSTNKNISKSPTKNQEPTINTYFSGRQKFNA